MPNLKKHYWPIGILLATWGGYFCLLFSRVIQIRPAGLFLGHENVWSDWALHVGLAHIFAYQSPSDWFSYHPVFADGALTYPFMTDMISGLLIRAGWSLTASFIVPSLVLCFVWLIGAYGLFGLLLRSRIQAVVAISLFLLSAGTGFGKFIVEFLAHPSWGQIWFPAAQFARYDQYQWYAGNVIVGLLLPQRAFLLGITLGVWSLVGLLAVILDRCPLKYRRLVLLVSGLIAGILPVAHVHTLIVLVVIAGLICLTAWRRWRDLAWYVVPAGVVSGSLYAVFLAGKIANPHFFGWMPGYTATGGFVGWLILWWRLFGVMLPLAAWAMWIIFRRLTPAARGFFGGGTIVFALANLIRFQPAAWDNSKLLYWSYFVFCGLAAAGLAWLWRRAFTGKIIAIALAGLLTFSGALELIRLQHVDRNGYLVTTTEEMTLGISIRQLTDSGARFLTATNHNNFIMIWAVRPIILGYTAWVWNYGFDYSSVERDVKIMFLGGESSRALLRQHRVSYVVIGPKGQADFPANEAFFVSQFPLAFQSAHYRVYDTRSVL